MAPALCPTWVALIGLADQIEERHNVVIFESLAATAGISI
jgi:hypothetical protein